MNGEMKKRELTEVRPPSFLFHSIGRSYGTVGSVLKGGVFKEFLTSYVFTWILLRFAADYAIKFD